MAAVPMDSYTLSNMSIAPDASPTLVTPSLPTRVAPRTAADWLASLGDVPLDRILFDPLPGTATEADLIRMVERKEALCEWIDGTLVEKAMGFQESLIALRIAFSLQSFVIPRKLGAVSGADGMMRILPRQIRLPDVAFCSSATLRYRDPADKAPAIAPDLAVEVLSESNTRSEMTLKLAEYFEAGTRLVWYVEPRTRTVDVYSTPTDVTRLTDADTLTGGDVMPGFECRVAEFFAID